jgi:hypothetical protein
MDIERRAFTLNSRYYSDYKNKFLSYYRACREKDGDTTSELIKNLQTYRPPAASRLPSTDFQDGMARVLSGLPQVGINGVKPVDLAKLLPSDPMDQALHIMAGVRAYFQGWAAYLLLGILCLLTFNACSRTQEIHGCHIVSHRP